MRLGKRHLTHHVGLVAGVICLHALVLWLLSTHVKPVRPSHLTLWLQTTTAPPSFKPAQNLPIQQALVTNQHHVLPLPQRQKGSKNNTPDIVPDRTTGDLPAQPAVPAVPTISVLTDSAAIALSTQASTSQVQSDHSELELAPPVTQLPSSTADYLHNPHPAYPAISLRMGEQGKVVIRVLISKDGLAHQGTVVQSSGFDRLDRAALQAVLGWRYVPGTQAGIAQDMWFDVPLNFAPN